MRVSRHIALILALSVGVEAAEVARHPYRRQWAHAMFGPRALVRTAAGAALQQARNSPHEWGRTLSGFGKRAASGFGKHAINTSVEYAVAAARHEDLRYYPPREGGFGPRLRHALVSTVVTRKTTNGERTVAAGRISGSVASGFISRLWQPASLRTAGSGASSAGIALGADAGANVVREFWPEIRHPRAHGHHGPA
jgi:hypothetical protein